MTGDVVCVAMVMSDHAIREAGTGKLSMIGAFSGFNAPSFPFQASRFVVSVFLSNFRGHPEPVDVTVRVEQPSTAHVLVSGHGRVTFNAEAPKIEPHLTIDVMVPIPSVVFPEQGVYDVVLLVNTFEASRRHIFVKSLTARTDAEG